MNRVMLCMFQETGDYFCEFMISNGMKEMLYISSWVTALRRMKLKRSLQTALFSDAQKGGIIQFLCDQWGRSQLLNFKRISSSLVKKPAFSLVNKNGSTAKTKIRFQTDLFYCN